MAQMHQGSPFTVKWHRYCCFAHAVGPVRRVELEFGDVKYIRVVDYYDTLGPKTVVQAYDSTMKRKHLLLQVNHLVRICIRTTSFLHSSFS